MLPPATSRTVWIRCSASRAFKHVAAGAAADGLDDELPVVVGGEHDHPDLGVVVAELAGGLEAVHLGHPDVDQRDVGVLRADQVEQLLAVGGLAHDLDAVGHVEVAAQPCRTKEWSSAIATLIVTAPLLLSQPGATDPRVAAILDGFPGSSGSVRALRRRTAS